MDEGYVLLGTIAAPLIAALLLMAVPSATLRPQRVITGAASTIMFALSIYAFVAYDYGAGGLQMELRWAWLENIAFLGENGISLYLANDGFAAPMMLLTGLVIFAGTLISFKITTRTKDFFILLYVLVAGVFGVFVSQDLFFFFFWYEVAVLPMYLLIAVWGSTRREYGAMKLTLMLVAASVMVWIGIFAIFHEAGVGTFELAALQNATYSEDFQKLFFPIIVIGFGVLAGLWPFHTWSPDGHVAAPTAVSMLHAGVLMKLGAFGILRVAIAIMPEGAQFWMPALMVLGTINVLYGAMSAFAQKDLKFVIGYSSVSHMGYVIMGLATLNTVGVTGAVLQMFAHRRDDRPLLRHGGRHLRPGAHPGDRHLRRHGPPDATIRRLLLDRRPGVARTARAGRIRRGVPHLRRHLPHLPGARRPCGGRGGHHRRLHPAIAGVGVLRAVQ